MRRGFRSAAFAAVVCSLLSMSVAAAGPAAANAGTTSLHEALSPSYGYCDEWNVSYTGGPEANNLTITGQFAVDWPGPFAQGPICWTLSSSEVDVVDSNVTIQPDGPNCSSLGSAASCAGTVIDTLTISTGDGHDSIRVVQPPAILTTIDAGAGDDAIRALDGVPEDITCGDGDDVVIADAVDTVSSDCEVVQLQAPDSPA